MNFAQPFFVAQAQSPVTMLPFVLIIFSIFYFVVIRPQQTEQKNHQTMLASLKKDDRVTTTGGLHGKIVEVKEHLVVLEVAHKVEVIIDKPSVKQRLTEADSAASTKEPAAGASKGS